MRDWLCSEMWAMHDSFLLKENFDTQVLVKCWSAHYNTFVCTFGGTNRWCICTISQGTPLNQQNIFAIGNVESFVCMKNLKKKYDHFGLLVVCWTFSCINRTLYVLSILFTITRGSHSTRRHNIIFRGISSQTAIYIS